MSVITVAELAMWRKQGFECSLLDVRRESARRADGGEIEGSLWLDPSLWLDWKDGVSKERPAIVYCAHGHEISQGLTAALRAMGIDARHLDGGMSGWRAAGQGVRGLRR